MSPSKTGFRYNHVLLIDDASLDNFINEKTITLCNFAKNVYVNTSATSALEFLNNLISMGREHADAHPQVIFIDINMPMIDGFQFIGSFRKDIANRLGNPKLVILTSSVFENDREKTRAVSKDIFFLNKPLTKEMLEKL